MKNPNFLLRMLNILGFICTPATLILAVLWYLQPGKNYEPITVALGSASAIFFASAQIIHRKKPPLKSNTKRIEEMTTDEILNFVKESEPSEWDVNFSQDAEIAIFKKYPALRIETKHTDAFVHNDDFYEKWANRFPDKHAASYYYHLYFGATRLKDFILVSVDGGRALLPLPKNALDLRVEKLRYKIALIFDQFETCNEYMRRAGLLVE